MEALGRPRAAAKVQTRLHFDRPIVWRRPRNPLGEFLLIGPHPTHLPRARGDLHVPHRKTPVPVTRRVWRIVQASPRIVIPAPPTPVDKVRRGEGTAALSALQLGFCSKRRGMDMEIKRCGSQASRPGPPDNFTGTVRIDPLFDAPEP